MEAFRFVAAPALVLLLALLAFAPADASVEEVCENATKGSEYYGFCVSTLKSAAGNGDVYGLTVAATKQSKDTFESNIARIDELLKKAGLDKPSERALRACANVYGRGVSKLQQAANRLEAKDFYGAANYLSTSRDDAVSCGDVFTKFGIESLLQSENDAALKRSFLAIHIAQSLK